MHYDKERDRIIEDKLLNGVEVEPKITKGEVTLLLALAFVVGSLIILLW